MKVLFTLASVGAFTLYDEVVRELCRRDHSVHVWYGPLMKASVSDRALVAAGQEFSNCISGHLRRARFHRFLSDIREIRGCGVYFNPRHLSPWLEKRWEGKLSPPLQMMIRVPPFRRWAFGRHGQSVMRRLEEAIPPDPAIIHQLQTIQPDILIASPYIYARPLEPDYVKAARRLGIPTIAVVQSWDNLTTKGTYGVMPDVLLVWNQPLVEEAVELHGVPRERIIVMGAPYFDAWFATTPSCSRADFCRKVGFDPHQQYVTFLCSSNFIAGDETAYVKELAAAMSRDPATQHLKLLVRPYPSNAAIWEGVSIENIIVWPPKGDMPDIPETRQIFFDSLFYGVAAFGVNTTAFLEAAIMDKPCVTAFTERYRRSQLESAHFQHLLRADFIETAESFEGAASLLAAIASGKDGKAGNRRRFVKDFIRPWGVEQPAAPVMAGVIEGLAGGMDMQGVRAWLAERFRRG